MGATKIEFRLRVAIMAVFITLGFWSPWIEVWGIGERIPLLEWLALEMTRLGLVNFVAATPIVIVLGALVAAKGVVFRVWGTAYLGVGIVNHGQMKAGAVMADGPYRYLRNPLYLGSWCMFATMSMMMPVTGALFAMVFLTIFLFRLILGEEAFLSGQLGDSYKEYQRAVPRVFPRLHAGLPAAGVKPRWGHALLAETNPIGIFLILAALSWSYDNRLMVKAVIVSFGISLVARALTPGLQKNA